MRNLDQIIASLPADRRTAVEARARKLVSEEKALRQLRRARALTQQALAEALHVDQARVSRIEKSSDMMISTMRSYVEAMGGTLRFLAEFDDGGTVELSTIGEVGGSSEPEKRRRRTMREPKVAEA